MFIDAELRSANGGYEKTHSIYVINAGKTNTSLRQNAE